MKGGLLKIDAGWVGRVERYQSLYQTVYNIGT